MYLGINECGPNPCRNRATSNDMFGYYACDCENGWMGINWAQDRHNRNQHHHFIDMHTHGLCWSK